MKLATKVIHIEDAPQGWENDAQYVYIGKPKYSSYKNFYNPFCYKYKNQSGVAKESFRSWLISRPTERTIQPKKRKWILQNVHTLYGKILVCDCDNLNCSAYILASLAEHQPLWDNIMWYTMLNAVKQGKLVDEYDPFFEYDGWKLLDYDLIDNTGKYYQLTSKGLEVLTEQEKACA